MGEVFLSPISTFSVVYEGPAFPLIYGENLIGRAPECQIAVIGGSVSRAHARIIVSPTDALVEDLGSTNGTFVAQRRITAPTPLCDGDLIRIGKERLRFLAPGHRHAPTEPEHGM